MRISIYFFCLCFLLTKLGTPAYAEVSGKAIPLSFEAEKHPQENIDYNVNFCGNVVFFLGDFQEDDLDDVSIEESLHPVFYNIPKPYTIVNTFFCKSYNVIPSFYRTVSCRYILQRVLRI